MSGLITSDGVLVVKKFGSGIEVNSYGDELQAVKEMVSNGSLGKYGGGFGSSGHLEAVKEVRAHIDELIFQIAQQIAKDGES
jgi:hypothetical protein